MMCREGWRPVLPGLPFLWLFERGNFGRVDVAARVPQVVRGLHIQPDGRIVSEHLANAYGHLGRDRLFFGKEVIKRLPRDAEMLGYRCLRQLERRENDIPKQLARMGRATLWISDRKIVRQSVPPARPLLIVPLEIDIDAL